MFVYVYNEKTNLKILQNKSSPLKNLRSTLLFNFYCLKEIKTFIFTFKILLVSSVVAASNKKENIVGLSKWCLSTTMKASEKDGDWYINVERAREHVTVGVRVGRGAHRILRR